MKKKLLLVLSVIAAQAISAQTKKYKPLEFATEEIKKEKIKEFQEFYPTKENVLFGLSQAKAGLLYEALPKNNDPECENHLSKHDIERMLFMVENTQEFDSQEIKDIKIELKQLVQQIVCKEECEEQKKLLEQQKAKLQEKTSE